jgi:hypothetical protein
MNFIEPKINQINLSKKFPRIFKHLSNLPQWNHVSQYLLIDELIDKVGIVLNTESGGRHNDRYEGYIVFKEKNIFGKEAYSSEKINKRKFLNPELARIALIKYAMELIEEEIGLSGKALKED